MLSKIATGVAVLVLVLVWGCGRAEGLGSPVDQARAAFKTCARAVKAGDMGTARNYLSREMREDANGNDGQLGMALGLIASMNIDEFTGRSEGDRVVFEKKETRDDMTMSMSFAMVNEAGRWKLAP